MAKRQVDILIVGGGLTGAALMLALANENYTTLLVDKHSLNDRLNADFDARTLALSPASVAILQGLKVWPILQRGAVPIQTIEVSEQGGFGLTRLQGDPGRPLGYVVEMQEINRVLAQLLYKKMIYPKAELTALDQNSATAQLTTQQGKLLIEAKLIIAADGTQSAVRSLSGLKTEVTDYHQAAIVANIGLARPHGNAAFERFTSAGPLALLPMTENRAALVWALVPEEANQLFALKDSDFLMSLQKAVGYRLGRFDKLGRRVIYPLKQSIMPQQTAWPLVFVGNAAHTLHPVAGQGFNLGLRDVALLAQCISQRGLNPAMLAHYESLRRADQQAIIGLTNNLVRLFTSRLPGVATARNLGLLVMDNSLFLRKKLLRIAAGFTGPVGNLACGIPLNELLI